MRSVFALRVFPGWKVALPTLNPSRKREGRSSPFRAATCPTFTLKLTHHTPLLKGPRLTGTPAGAAVGRPDNLGLQEERVAANEPGQDPIGDENPMRDVRLSELDARLKAATGAEQARAGTAPRKPQKGYSQGSRVLTELIAGPAGGALIGWFLDRLFGTSPWLLLVLLFLGFAVAIRNIYRISQQRPE